MLNVKEITKYLIEEMKIKYYMKVNSLQIN